MNEYRVMFAPSGSQKTAPYPNFEKAVETFPVSRFYNLKLGSGWIFGLAGYSAGIISILFDIKD